MRRVTHLAAVAVSAGILAGLASAAQQPGATYRGTTTDNGFVDLWLLVSHDGTAVTRVLVGDRRSGCPTLELMGPHQIDPQHHFHVEASGEVVDGSFPTDNTAAGTMQLERGSSCELSGPWTAKVTDQPIPPPWGPPPPPPPPPVPARCHVPRVVGMPLPRARFAIRSDHCTTGRVRYRRSSRPKKRVIAQRPAAGRYLANGGAMILTVSRGRARK
jgi:hypothetical protein